MNQTEEESNAIWTQLAPFLDECVEELRGTDRDALLLRFFERQSAKEIGARLGISEEAAQKRVARALERLRESFANRGITTSSAGLTGAIAAGAIQSAPPALAGSVIMHAITTAAAGSALASILTFMASIQTKMAAAVIVTAGLGGAALYEHSQNQALRAQLAAYSLRDTAAKAVETPPPAADAGLSQAERMELLRLRGEITLLRQQLRDRPRSPETPPNPAKQPQPGADTAGFIAADTWRNVGFDTPGRAFESFLAILKNGNTREISEVPHWEVNWKENPTPEDIALVERTRQDYLDLLERAGKKIAGFMLAPASETGDRTRVHFQTLSISGQRTGSSFVMVHTGGVWKPLISMGWGRMGSSLDEFATSPLFGPKIDLED